MIELGSWGRPGAGAVVSEVARRHRLTPQQLFTSRRGARETAQKLPVFVPAMIDPEPRVETSAEPPRRRRGRPKTARTAIEVESFGVDGRIAEGAAPAMIAAAIGALKTPR